jgi:hypothetical protein
LLLSFSGLALTSSSSEDDSEDSDEDDESFFYTTATGFFSSFFSYSILYYIQTSKNKTCVIYNIIFEDISFL